MKKLFALILAFCMILSLAACGGGSDTTTTAGTKENSNTATTAAPTEKQTEKATEKATEQPTDAPAEEITLKLWCIATESDANRPAYQQAIADYEAAHPGIKIEMEAFENESYKTKIKAAMMGGDASDLPDIFFNSQPAFRAERVCCIC